MAGVLDVREEFSIENICWAMENRQINLGQFNAKTIDPLLLFAEFRVDLWQRLVRDSLRDAGEHAVTSPRNQSAIVATGFATGYQPS